MVLTWAAKRVESMGNETVVYLANVKAGPKAARKVCKTVALMAFFVAVQSVAVWDVDWEFCLVALKVFLKVV